MNVKDPGTDEATPRVPPQHPSHDPMRYSEADMTRSPQSTGGRHSLLQEVEDFLSSEPPLPHFRSLDERIDYLIAYQRRLHSAGLAVPGWPRELGGRGVDASDAVAVSVALGKAGAPELINFVATDVIGPGLMKYAEHHRLAQWMPRMATAEDIWCQLFSEPDAGSDLTALRTTARRTGHGWSIDGQKVWSTWAQYAHYGLLLARTGSPESRHRGISAFVVDMTSPGIEIRPLRTMTGTTEFAEVFFSGVQLDASSLVGEVDQGWAVAQVILNAERGTYAARRAAVIEAAFRQLVASAPRPLDASKRQRVVTVHTLLRLLQWQVETVMRLWAAGEESASESAMTKLLMTEAEQATQDLCVQLGHIGAGAWLDSPATEALVEEYLYSRAASIYGGSSQIQRNILAERGLGLPR